MAGEISGLTALASGHAAGDLIEILDVSDTTMSANGTNKKTTLTQLLANVPVPIISTSTFSYTGTANRIGTATTADALADTLLATSATTQKGLVVQMKASQTAHPFSVQTSAGVATVSVQSDGGLIVDQRTGATYTTPLDVKYQGVQQLGVTVGGLAIARVGFNGGGGFFTTDAAGNVVAFGDVTSQHLIGRGTSPTVTGNGSSNGSVAGKDSGGKITVGTGVTTSIVLTFGTAYATAPALVVVAQTTVTAINVVTTTTTATLTTTAFTAGEVLSYVTVGF